MMTTVPALPVRSCSLSTRAPGSGSRPHRWEPGTMRSAPFSSVKSSSIQTELQTQYPRSSATAPLSACSGWPQLLRGLAERTFRLLSLKSGPNTAAYQNFRSFDDLLEDLTLVHPI